METTLNTPVIYDSNDGNAARVARAIGRALRAAGRSQVRAAADLRNLPSDLDLLVIGGAGRTLRISDDMKRLLAALPDRTLQEVSVAAFATRPTAPGFVANLAARHTERALCRKGARMLTALESFLEEDGALLRGELERAATWARQLADDKAGAFAPRLVAT